MKRLRALAFAALGASALGCQDPPAAPGATQPGVWRTDGDALKDPEGRTLVLRGMNLAGAHKNKPYWGFQQPPDYARLRDDWGMSSVRFLVTWAAIEPQKGTFDDAYLAELDKRVGWAEDAGLLVVVDMHQDLYGEGFPGGDGAPLWTCDAKYYAAFKPTNPWALGYFDPNLEHCVDALYTDAALQEHFTSAWAKVAERLAHHANVIGFDVLNEPSWGSFSWSDYEAKEITPLYEKAVAAVRAKAPQWIAFVEPGGTRNAGLATSLGPFTFKNLVYAPHSYDVNAEGASGFDVGHRADVIANLASLRDEARAIGAALWIGEYGGKASLPNIGPYMVANFDGAGAVAAGTAYWSYDKSDNFGFLDLNGNEKPALAAAVVRPYPERVAGALASYAYDDAKKTLTFMMTSDASITAPTLVSLPPRLYPNGADIACGGCDVAMSKGGASLTKIPAGAQTITVRAR